MTNMTTEMGDLKKFEGTWNCVSDENFDKFVEEMGVGWMKRKVVTSIKPTLIFEVSDGTLKITRKGVGPTKDFVNLCKLNAEEEHTTPDGYKIKQTTTYSDGKLMQENQPMDKNTKPNTVIREVKGDEMVTTMTVNAVTAKRLFKKVT